MDAPLKKAVQETAAFDAIYASRIWGFSSIFVRFITGFPRRPKNGNVGNLCCLPLGSSIKSRMTLQTAGRYCISYWNGKTGTSALQRFFDLNRERLQKRGIIYPQSAGRMIAHHRLVWSLMAEQEAPKQNWPDDLQTPQQEWEQLQRQILFNRGILSSEHFLGLSVGRFLK
jgi:hypothetical protein